MATVGGVELGETIRTAAARELYEESGIQALPQDLEKVAVVDFHNTKTDSTIFRCRVHVFLAPVWSGEVKETSEMRTPTWFPILKLPLDEMMPADWVWLPLVFEGRKITASAFYGPFQKELLGPVEVKNSSERELEEI